MYTILGRENRERGPEYTEGCAADLRQNRVETMKKALLKKRSPQPVTADEHHEQAATAEGSPVIAKAAAAQPDHVEILSSLASYIRRFLVCNDHQLTILALWTLYTWCYNYFPTAAYLDIHSPGPQSGKSRCLKILYGLCYQPDLIAGADSRTARHRLLRPCRMVEQIAAGKKTGPHTFLFDDCHLALGTSERQPLLALLNSGSGIAHYSVMAADYMVFGPKAFAASAPLPRSLASRCIPIKLRRKKLSEKVDNFVPGKHHAVNQNDTQNEDGLGEGAGAFQLPRSLERWAEVNGEALQQANGDAITLFCADRPAGLSPAQQDCAEPLLRIADRMGGGWPQRARAAIAVLFNVPQHEPALQLLADIRDCFVSRDNPDRLATRDILAWLLNLDNRPWTTGTTRSVWNSNSGRRLGALLEPYGISSGTFSFGRKKLLKGYELSQFKDAWERYLPPISGKLAGGAEQNKTFNTEEKRKQRTVKSMSPVE